MLGIKTYTATRRTARRTGGLVASLCGMLVVGGLAATPAAAAPTLFRITPVGISFSSVLVGTTSPSQTVTVTNVAGSSVVMAGTGGTVAAPFSRTNGCAGATLGAGASCNVTFSFHPTGAGSASTTAAGSFNGQAYSIFMSGSGATPKFDVNTSSVKFGRELVGLDAPQTTIGITNVSPAAIVLSATGGGVAAPFSRVTDCTGTLQPGDDCHETFGYHPTAATSLTATSTMTLNGQAIAVNLSGTGAAPTLRISGTKLSFGATVVGTSAPTQAVNVTNLSAQTITVSMTGGSAVAPYSSSQNCQAATLAWGQSCQINYTFHPTATGTVNATSTGTINGIAFSIKLNGKGVSAVPALPTYRMTPAALSFSSVVVGTTSPVQQVLLTNISTSPITTSGNTSQPGNGFSWTLSGCASPLPVGSSCILNFVFSPTVAGAASGTSTGNINGQAISISMNGTGVTPKFNVTSSSVKFGHWLVGTAAVEQTVLITNASPGPVTMSGTAGTPAAPFALTSNCSGVTLNPGDFCVDFFDFGPTVVATSSAVSTDTWNGQTVTVALSGSGVNPTWLITPTKLSYGPVANGTTSAGQTVTFTNLSARPVTLAFAAGLSGTYGAGTTCFSGTLNYGDTCIVEIWFEPTAVGTATGSVSGTINGVPWIVNMTGKGV